MSYTPVPVTATPDISWGHIEGLWGSRKYQKKPDTSGTIFYWTHAQWNQHLFAILDNQENESSPWANGGHRATFWILKLDHTDTTTRFSMTIIDSYFLAVAAHASELQHHS